MRRSRQSSITRPSSQRSHLRSAQVKKAARASPRPDTRDAACLPRPSAGDLFLDLEADPYAGADGVTYLFGIAMANGEYKSWWAHDALQEKQAALSRCVPHACRAIAVRRNDRVLRAVRRNINVLFPL